MSRLSLSEVLDRLEEEFEEAESSYLAEKPPTVDEFEDNSTSKPVQLDDSFVLDSPLLESSVLEDIEEESFEDEDVAHCSSRTDLDNTNSSGEVEVEVSIDDEEEEKKIDRFIKQTCGCVYGPK